MSKNENKIEIFLESYELNNLIERKTENIFQQDINDNDDNKYANSKNYKSHPAENEFSSSQGSVFRFENNIVEANWVYIGDNSKINSL